MEFSCFRRWDQLPEGADVAMAWDALVADLPAVAGAASVVRFARNGAYVPTTEPLADGDELAVIPPVAGGSEEAGDDPWGFLEAEINGGRDRGRDGGRDRARVTVHVAFVRAVRSAVRASTGRCCSTRSINQDQAACSVSPAVLSIAICR